MFLCFELEQGVRWQAQQVSDAEVELTEERVDPAVFVLGLFLGSNELLMQIGIWVFLAAVLFQIVTLPVEFDASHRAMGFLTEYGILSENEADGSRRVLRAAAMTYVAAAAAALLNLLRLVMLSRRDDRRD